MRVKHWIRKAALWRPDWTLPWWKPAHLDRFRRARMKRSKHIKRTPPRRQSFKHFWREQATHQAAWSKTHPRRWRRAMVLEWYRADKRQETF